MGEREGENILEATADGRLGQEHAGFDPTVARIREAHSLMAPEWLAGDEEVHRAYKQGHDERCYICALLALNERYRDALLDILDLKAGWTALPASDAFRLLDAADDMARKALDTPTAPQSSPASASKPSGGGV